MSNKIDKAFINAFQVAAFLPANNIAYENKPFDAPKQTAATAELLMISNDGTPLTLRGSTEETGIFRIILRCPINAGAVALKELAEQIKARFAPRSRVAYEGQSAIVTSANRRPGADEPGKYKQVVDVTYRAFLPRG